MHRLAMTLLRFLTIVLVAVCVTNANPLFAQCAAEVEAIPRGDITPNGPVIASQCPEACPNYAAGQYQSYGWGYDGLDFIEVRCTDLSQTLAKIYSTPRPDSTASTCWNCVGGCGVNCPAGELCMPVPWSAGSDCKRFGCPAGYLIAERQTIVGGETKTEPYCRRDPAVPCPPVPPPPPEITIVLDGPATIRTGTTCTWTANAFGGTGAPKSYSWSVSNNPVATGQWYTGGRPSGTLIGYSWRLRVSVTDGVKHASQEMLVREESNAPICFN